MLTRKQVEEIRHDIEDPHRHAVKSALLALCDDWLRLDEENGRQRGYITDLAMALVWALGELNAPEGESDPLFGFNYDNAREALHPHVGQGRYDALARQEAGDD